MCQYFLSKFFKAVKTFRKKQNVLNIEMAYPYTYTYTNTLTVVAHWNLTGHSAAIRAAHGSVKTSISAALINTNT